MPSPVHYGQLRVIRRTLTLRAKINSSEDVLNLSKLRGFSIWKHVLCLLTLKELSEIQAKASVEHADRAAFFSIVQLAVLYAGGSLLGERVSGYIMARYELPSLSSANIAQSPGQGPGLTMVTTLASLSPPPPAPTCFYVNQNYRVSQKIFGLRD